VKLRIGIVSVYRVVRHANDDIRTNLVTRFLPELEAKRPRR
jgi:hypothetical protein